MPEDPSHSADFDYDSIETGYYDRVFRRNSGIQSKWHHMNFAHVRAEMGKYESHLDVGCGPGTFIGTLDENVPSIGIDIAANQIDYATQTYANVNHRFKVTEPGALPFESASFDVVTLLDVLEHLDAAANENMIEETLRVLRPNGRVLVVTANYGSLWPVVEWIVNKLGQVSYEDQHIFHFKRSTLDRFLKTMGLIDVELETFLLTAPFAAALGWRFSDALARLEPKPLVSRYGLYLLAKGRKPA